jgi:hypothetical protein
MIRKLTLYLLLVGQLGLPFLQVVAWVSMVSSHTLSSPSINVAIEKTFDGQNPCELCKAISAAEQQKHGDEGAPMPSSKRDIPTTYLSQLPLTFCMVPFVRGQVTEHEDVLIKDLLTQFIQKPLLPPPLFA